MVPATLAGLILALAGCTLGNSVATNSPSPSPTATVSPTPGTSPTPAESPNPETSPSPAVSPSPATLIITRLPFHAGEVGVGYVAVALGAAGGVKPYKWSIEGGALPPGMALSSGGSTTGTPTATGNFSFVVRVGDAAGGAAGAPRTITVVPHLKVNGRCTNYCDVESGCATVCGGFGSQSGGLAPYRYRIVAGGLPKQMGLNGLSVTGTFQLLPCTSNCGSGPIDFTVAVTDALGATGKVHALFDVFRHVTFTETSATCTQSSAACATQLTYSGGTPNGKPTVKVGPFLDANGQAEGAPPKGFIASASGGVVNVSAAGQNYFATVTLILVDQSVCGPGSTHCSSNVATVTINL